MCRFNVLLVLCPYSLSSERIGYQESGIARKSDGVFRPITDMYALLTWSRSY